MSTGRGRGASRGRGHGVAVSPGEGRGRDRGRGRGGGRGRGRGGSRGQAGRTDTWTWTSAKSSSNTPASIPFSGDLPGPKGDACCARQPVECFNLFLGDYYNEILQQSNLYADQQRTTNSDTSPWNPISKEELLAFIGLNIAMGVISRPALNDYWSTDIIHCQPWFRSVMPRNRFRQILRYVHVANNSKALIQATTKCGR